MSGAARRLGLAQSKVSGHVGALEPLQDTHSLQQGQRHLCAVGPNNVTPMLRRFRDRWPGMRLLVSVGGSTEIVERALARRGDLRVLVHAVDDPRIHSVPYRRQTLIAFASLDHPLAHRRTLALRDLQGQAFVMREPGSTTRQVFEAGLARAGVTVGTVLEIGSREGVREALAQGQGLGLGLGLGLGQGLGLGLGVVADSADMPDPRLVPRPFADTCLQTHSQVICLRERRHARRIASLLAVVEALRGASGEGGMTPPGSRRAARASSRRRRGRADRSTAPAPRHAVCRDAIRLPGG